MSVHIEYRLANSDVHGIGCFTVHPIKSGALIASASPLDINISQEAFDRLPESERQQIRHHGHLDAVSGLWHVDFDMTRFANHSSKPNIQQRYHGMAYYIVAIQDVAAGEELLIDYADFEHDHGTRKIV